MKITQAQGNGQGQCALCKKRGRRMTLDEAIIHAEEIVEEHEKIKCIKAVTLEECKWAEEHRQLAEWLKELKQLREQTKWIPVSNPQKELPKDRMLWVTIDDDRYAQDTGGYYWMGGLTVTQIYWDMTEWSENIVDYVLAYMDYTEPTPYKAESEASRG